MPVATKPLNLDPADSDVDAAIREVADLAKTTAQNVRKKIEAWAHELQAAPHHLLAVILLVAKTGAEDMFKDEGDTAGSH